MSHSFEPQTLHTIPARSAVAVPLSVSQTLTVINTHGTQVIDFWCFQLPSSLPKSGGTEATPFVLHTYYSTSHTRASTLHLSPLVDDTLVTNVRSPILEFVADTTPAVHDTLIPACDSHRYRQLGVPEGTYHANCTDNLFSALRSRSLTLPSTCSAPDPLNLFMNIPIAPLGPTAARAPNNVTAGGNLSFEAPVGDKGGSVTFRALVDCLAVMSACPQDLVKVNAMAPTEAHFRVT